MLLLFSSWKSVYFTLHPGINDDRCITSYTHSALGYNYHIHPGGFFDPLMYRDRNMNNYMDKCRVINVSYM